METLKKTCACTGSTLGKFIQPILLDILRRRKSNGYQIVKEMESYPTFEGSKPDPTGIYRYLHAMEEKQLIVSDAAGVYEMTEAGKDCFENWKRTLRVYFEQLARLAELMEADPDAPEEENGQVSD